MISLEILNFMYLVTFLSSGVVITFLNLLIYNIDAYYIIPLIYSLIFILCISIATHKRILYDYVNIVTTLTSLICCFSTLYVETDNYPQVKLILLTLFIFSMVTGCYFVFKRVNYVRVKSPRGVDTSLYQEF